MMPETGGGSWWAVVGWPAIAASVPGAIALWQWYGNRQDKRDARLQSAAERRETTLLEERKTLAAEQRDILAWVEQERDRLLEEVKQLRQERRVLERDRDRGWQLGRHYHRLAEQLAHAMNNARQIAEYHASQVRPPVRLQAWVAIPVPVDMEAPFPRADAAEEKA